MWEGSDKDNQARGNGCFWSTRRSTNGEEEAEAWEEVRVLEFNVCSVITLNEDFSIKLNEHFLALATNFCATLT